MFVEKFLDTVYLSTDLFSNDLSLAYIFYPVDSKAAVDIMYDIREFKRESTKRTKETVNTYTRLSAKYLLAEK